MKKIIVLVLLLLVLPITVFAAEAPTVTKLVLSNEKGVIKYSGEVQDPNPEYGSPSYAVMCKLYNSKDEEIDYLSSEVNEHKFEGSFTVTKNDTYKVSCANYEGGEFKSETIVVKAANPKTGDTMLLYVALGVVSVVALIGCVRFAKEK